MQVLLLTNNVNHMSVTSRRNFFMKNILKYSCDWWEGSQSRDPLYHLLCDHAIEVFMVIKRRLNEERKMESFFETNFH
jgi:hypothetical protein